ncbi:MAG: hypothetical protein KC621_29205 [Myxococcales bacterium]|nr:hypothetical protein [Myxococcales bacterium]
MAVALEPIGADPNQVELLIQGPSHPVVEWQSDARPTPLAAQVSPGASSDWVAVLTGLSTAERGPLLVSDAASDGSTVAFGWVLEGPANNRASEIHALDGELAVTLAEETAPNARVSILRPPGRAAMAGPYLLSATSDLTRVGAVFSPALYAQGFPDDVASALRVFRDDGDSRWREVPSVVHSTIGRVAFEAELPGTYVLAEIEQ